MLMVKIEALLLNAESYFYGGNLFSGIGYKTDADRRITPVEIDKGKITGNHAFDFFPVTSSGIDISGFTEDDVNGYGDDVPNNFGGLSYMYVGMQRQLCLDKEPYTGVGYVFSGIFCVRALAYRDGFLVADAEWDKSGLLLNLVIEDGVDQYYSWYPDGELKSAQLSISEASSDRGMVTKLRAMLRFSSEKKLSSVSLEGDLASLEEAMSRAELFPVNSVKDLRGYEMAEPFSFTGDAIDYNEFVAIKN